MRSLVASAVEQDPDEFSEAILGMPNVEYCKWIMEPDAWGGAIELSILSKYYGIEIAVVDSINAIINRFGEDHHYPLRVFLMFDGIHFDPLYLEREVRPLFCNSYFIFSLRKLLSICISKT